MTQMPAGWYPDPDPAAAATPGRTRYWDGTAWTEHVQDAAASAPPSPPAPPAAPPAYPSYPDASQGYPSYPSYPAGPPGAQPYYAPDGVTTPDGARLAGWWWRVLAQLIDWVATLAIMAAVLVPLFNSQWDSISDWVDQHTVDGTFSYSSGDELPPIFDITTGPGLTFYAVFFVVPLAYQLFFLRWKQATPGKLAVGLRVRLRERPELPIGSILARVGFVAVLSLLGQAPVIGFITGLVLLLDVLWPLWDKNKQALHDKVAKTNVIKVG